MEVVSEATIRTVRDTAERDPLMHIITALSEFTANKRDVIWMAQPEENAVYVHATEAKQFRLVVQALSYTIDAINQTLGEVGHTGRYHADPDYGRHCLDIYYTRI